MIKFKHISTVLTARRHSESFNGDWCATRKASGTSDTIDNTALSCCPRDKWRERKSECYDKRCDHWYLWNVMKWRETFLGELASQVPCSYKYSASYCFTDNSECSEPGGGGGPCKRERWVRCRESGCWESGCWEWVMISPSVDTRQPPLHRLGLGTQVSPNFAVSHH